MVILIAKLQELCITISVLIDLLKCLTNSKVNGLLLTMISEMVISFSLKIMLVFVRYTMDLIKMASYLFLLNWKLFMINVINHYKSFYLETMSLMILWADNGINLNGMIWLISQLLNGKWPNSELKSLKLLKCKCIQMLLSDF
jgi:hypothetical protein